MKKIFAASLIAVCVCAAARGDDFWWRQPTVCRIDMTKCYPSMGVGYDPEYWDVNAKCRGMKYICGQALKNGDEMTPVLMGRGEIERGDNIKTDFDTDLLNGDCFGARRISADGMQAFVNGKYVNIWCAGVLGNVDDIEYVANGEITAGTQPSCTQLRRDGYIAIPNGKCYGREYNDSEYFVECNNGTDSEPSRLIVLNGADYMAGGDAPANKGAANTLFNEMEKMAENQRKIYYK